MEESSTPTAPKPAGDDPSILPDWPPGPSLPSIFECDPQRCDPPAPSDPEAAAADEPIIDFPPWLSFPNIFGWVPGVDPPAPDPETAAGDEPSTDSVEEANAGGNIASSTLAATEQVEEVKTKQCDAQQKPTAGPPGTASRVSASCSGSGTYAGPTTGGYDPTTGEYVYTYPTGHDTPPPPQPDPPSPQGSGPIFHPGGSVQDPQEPREPAPEEPADPQDECPEGQMMVEGKCELAAPEVVVEGEFCSDVNAIKADGQGNAGAVAQCRQPPPEGPVITADNRTDQERERDRQRGEYCLSLAKEFPSIDCRTASFWAYMKGLTQQTNAPFKTLSEFEEAVKKWWETMWKMDPPGVDPRPRGPQNGGPNTPVDVRSGPPKPPEPILTPNRPHRATPGNKPILSPAPNRPIGRPTK